MANRTKNKKSVNVTKYLKKKRMKRTRFLGRELLGGGERELPKTIFRIRRRNKGKQKKLTLENFFIDNI